MRIIHGQLSGRRIHLPKNLKARPTTDRAREGLMNILINRFDFEVIRVLDLFAGTGAISFELASLGCSQLTAVDSGFQHVEAIRKNANDLRLPGIQALRTDALRYIISRPEPFDLIFADPPYDLDWLDDIPGRIRDAGILKPGATLILEHGPGHSFSEHPGFQEMRRYGKVHFSFFSF